MHLDEEWINGSEIATAIRVEVDVRLGDMKKSGLAVMWIGRQDSRTYEVQWSSGRRVPIVPGLVGGLTRVGFLEGEEQERKKEQDMLC